MNIVALHREADTRGVCFLTCTGCGQPVIVRFGTKPLGNYLPYNDYDWMLPQQFLTTHTIFAQYPPRPEARTVPSLPDSVAKAYAEAEANFIQTHNGTAAMAYRRVIERALKERFPGLTGQLNARIRQLEKTGVLPVDLIALADSVKLLGNDGAHDLDDPDADDVATARDFTHLFLTYVFELPARLAKATADRDARKAAHANA